LAAYGSVYLRSGRVEEFGTAARAAAVYYSRAGFIEEYTGRTEKVQQGRTPLNAIFSVVCAALYWLLSRGCTSHYIEGLTQYIEGAGSDLTLELSVCKFP